MHDAGAVVCVAQGHTDTSAPQELLEFVEGSGLLQSVCRVHFVRTGIVGEKTLHHDAVHFGDPGAGIGSFPSHLEADTAHAGVHHQVDTGRATHLRGHLRQSLGFILVKNSRS